MDQHEPRTGADAPAPVLLTNTIAKRAKAEREQVRDFSLDATVPGAIARVRMVDLNDPATLAALPETLLRQVLGVTEALEVGDDDLKPVSAKRPDGTIDVNALTKIMVGEARIIDATCVAGFIEPALIFSEADRTDDEQVLITDIHPSDRRRFHQWCNGALMREAAQIAPFPAGPAADVAAGGPGGMAEPATVPPVELTRYGAE